MATVKYSERYSEWSSFLGFKEGKYIQKVITSQRQKTASCIYPKFFLFLANL